MTLFELLEQGGPLMIPIGILSVVAATLTFERIWALREQQIISLDRHKNVLAFLRDNNHEAAESAYASDTRPMARITLAAFRHRGVRRTELKEIMEEAGAIEVPRMSRFVEGIGTIAAVAPLLGLLGTVTGMIDVFQKVSATADPQINELAGGIWEALVTTGAGLSVAIPSFLAYRWLESIVERRTQVLQECSLEVLDAMCKPTGISEGAV
jgi:biopolymer transport protein ExbB